MSVFDALFGRKGGEPSTEVELFKVKKPAEAVVVDDFWVDIDYQFGERYPFLVRVRDRQARYKFAIIGHHYLDSQTFKTEKEAREWGKSRLAAIRREYSRYGDNWSERIE